MSFYQLSEQDQAERLTDLARTALTRWDGAFVDLTLFKNRENAVFSVHREDGERLALRVHRAAYHSDAALRSELYWMRELEQSGIRVPPVFPASNGSLFVHAGAPGIPEVRQVDLLGWLDGAPITGREDERNATHRRIGELAARLHAHGSRIHPPADFTRHSWDEEGLLGSAPIWGRFWELPALSADQRALLLKARERATVDLAAFGKSAERYGMIHADLIRDNVLDDDGTLQAIDFDDCGFGWYLFELATVICADLGKPTHDHARAALLAGYGAVRPLTDADLDRLPLFLFLRASTYLGWLQTRAETHTAREMGPAHIERCCQLAGEYLDPSKRS